MHPPHRPAEHDPWRWSLGIALVFLALAWHRLDIPARIYFDEIHYVTAARDLLWLKSFNPEHPPLAKELIAAAMAMFGDEPLYWRLPAVLLGTWGLFAFARLMWFLTGNRIATLAGQYLLATGFAWFTLSRIAILDMPMAALAMTGLWMVAAAARHPAQAGWRLLLAGIAFGLSLAAKWSVAPVIVLTGLWFFAGKIRHGGMRGLVTRAGGPIPGISLPEAALWLGVVPLLVYWLCFTPLFFLHDRPVDPLGFVEHHRTMIALQDSVVKPHPYRSVWYQWVIDWRPIWFLFEHVDGAQRGVLHVGNPFTMIAGLPALVWCLWSRQRGALAMVALYAATLGLWIVSGKPVQFYYHYLLPGTFLCGALALAIARLHRGGRTARTLAWLALAIPGALFVWFYPILSAAPLSGPDAFQQWMILPSWI